MSLSDEILIEKLKITSKDRVLDIGGAMKQHNLINIDTVVDIIRPEEAPYTASNLQAKKFIKLDIGREKLPFKNKSFDIVLCTHTLEDLYNPFLVIEEMGRVGKRGYIATPSMGRDMVFSHIDYTDWLTGGRRIPGQSHHKWFYLNQGRGMLVIPKNYGILYSGEFQIVDWNGPEEFRLFWKNKIDWEMITDLNVHQLIDFYKEYIFENKSNFKFGSVLIYNDNPFYMFKALMKLLLKKGNGFLYRKKNK